MNSKNKNTLAHLEALAQLMDSKFRVPGTSMRFGLDAIIGLIPGAGDMAGLMVSSYIVLVLALNGASSYVIARITLNVLVDTAIGAIPVLGDIFDFIFKSNQRNMKLVREHYTQNKHQGSAWKVIIPLLLLILVVVLSLIWLIFSLCSWLLHQIL
ncbi:DUF4112 domain-containing protein [Flavobacterium sp. CYK-4]|uniref:DUF4112 domain-containing protein n=1 Tax=Flavobacterium lotistagni TaxID=2709660 RepID=UPI00140A283B|nr:DUF4112 domain-containing protein [Flavobacterium lotistagni]NHM07440.1 DUF4112 domain-containing protein [Flavobacterium lotistagni]